MRTQASSIQMLADASVPSERSDAPAPTIVEIGSTVTIRDLLSGERDDYTLVPPDQADITRGRISSMTPAGKALYGRAAGDTVAILAPGGIVRVAIESVRTPADE
jgi:transcription elongation factor GreA